jgi:hypothetical protein
MPSSYNTSVAVTSNARFTAASRCALSRVVLLLLVFDPLDRFYLSETTSPNLGLYVFYSLVLYASTHRWHPLVPGMVDPRVDVGRGVGLMALSGDPSGIFVVCSFFAIIIAAFQCGLFPSFRITLLAAILLLSVEVVLGHDEADFSFQHVLMGPVSLLVISYMIAFLGVRNSGSNVGWLGWKK